MTSLNRILMLEDLLTAKKHLVHCFPPEQSIFQYCVSLYHGAVTQKILDIINNGLEGTEVISLLQWVVQTYSGPELLGNEDLGLETDMIPAVLAPEEIHRQRFKWFFLYCTIRFYKLNLVSVTKRLAKC